MSEKMRAEPATCLELNFPSGSLGEARCRRCAPLSNCVSGAMRNINKEQENSAAARSEPGCLIWAIFAALGSQSETFSCSAAARCLFEQSGASQTTKEASAPPAPACVCALTLMAWM